MLGEIVYYNSETLLPVIDTEAPTVGLVEALRRRDSGLTNAACCRQVLTWDALAPGNGLQRRSLSCCGDLGRTGDACDSASCVHNVESVVGPCSGNRGMGHNPFVASCLARRYDHDRKFLSGPSIQVH